MTRVTVIIPTYNRCDLLAECLDSLAAQTYTDFETLIIDDGSEEGIAAFTRDAYPDVTVHRTEKNRGFACAVNEGIRRADSEFIFLLNNDMTLDPQCIDRLVDYAESESIDMTAPLVLWKDEPDRIYSAGDRIRTNGRPEAIGFREALEGYEHPGAIFGVSAGAALYRKDVFDSIGVFDETFVAYFEDSDLSFRARLVGFSAAYCPDARTFHVGSASIEGRTWWRARQCYRNHALLVIKNMPIATLLRHAPVILAERLHQTRRLISSARTEMGLARALLEWLKADISLIRALPHAFRQRRRIQRKLQITSAELENILSK